MLSRANREGGKGAPIDGGIEADAKQAAKARDCV